jgi:hypothetical protein
VKYKSIAEIVKRLSAEIEKLENGEMNVEELEGVLDDVRSLHERIAILQYLAVQSNTASSEERAPSSFSFGVDQSMLDSLREPPNQTNLLDAIERENFPDEIPFEDEPEEVVQPVAEAPAPIVEPEPQPEPVAVVEEKEEEKEESVEVETTEEPKSINETFSSNQEVESLAQRLGKKPISDLAEAIGLNQKFLFMNDLFEGENNLYKEAIQALNGFNSFFEADEYINVLSSRHSWDSTSKSVKDFIELVERRYS